MKKVAYDQMYQNELTHPWYVATRQLMAENLSKHLKAGSKILDVGCGSGGTILTLKRRGFKNIIGVDISKFAIDLAKSRGLKKVLYGSVNELPFKDKSFDAVVCLDVVYHEDVNVKKAFGEIYRVLKPGGIFYSQEPAYNWLKSRHDRAIDTRRRFSLGEIRNHLALTHFKIKSISYFNALLFPLIAAKRIIDKFGSESNFTSDVKTYPKVLNSLLSLVFTIEIALRKNSLNLPFGLSIVSLSKK